MLQGIPHMVKVRDLKYFLFTLIVAFSDVLGNGNLSLLYFWGMFMMFHMISSRQYWKTTFHLFVPFLILPLFSIVVHCGAFSIEKAIFYTVKMFLCVTIYAYFKINYQKVDLNRFIYYLTWIFGVFLVAAIITWGDELLWRTNDPYNSFSKIRLEFLYSEPSVLGLISGLMMIFIFYQVMTSKQVKFWLIPAVIFGCVLLLTFSISAMGYVVLSIAVYFLSNLNISKIRKVNRLTFILVLICLLGIICVFSTNNAISGRVFAVVSGQDGSFNFRYTAAYNSLLNILERTNNWGIGLGNMNTEEGLRLLLLTGIDHKFANSFMYFVAENGFLGIGYIIFLFFVCLKGILESKRRHQEVFKLKLMLLVFVFASQIAGGYFTDPILWSLYGIICSN